MQLLLKAHHQAPRVMIKLYSRQYLWKSNALVCGVSSLLSCLLLGQVCQQAKLGAFVTSEKDELEILRLGVKLART